MKFITLLLFTLISLQAQNFTKENLLGMWEISSAKINKTVAFGNYIGKERNEVLELLFNTQGQMKIVKTAEVYNYEVVQGQLKIYDTKIYRNGYKVKRKNRYDLFKIIGSFEGCDLVKLMEKKIPGYNPKRDLKMCKISGMPQPTYESDISNYKF
ncbi:hypothetical protein [Candidatus Sulfurimonas baltica]|uniref:Uncharacterized protein n=1 Tax=Candidatus Sulfurimonas baltica TaxID=2740404 RepID=A0A7S7LSW0_9BACT|nr:hypothetical protein [Candidatus Sulfurimonas baltica]QOY50946.1 hypothetical protein HUE88_07255 [Candidatus Sulfurimonas baltica]